MAILKAKSISKGYAFHSLSPNIPKNSIPILATPCSFCIPQRPAVGGLHPAIFSGGHVVDFISFRPPHRICSSAPSPRRICSSESICPAGPLTAESIRICSSESIRATPASPSTGIDPALPLLVPWLPLRRIHCLSSAFSYGVVSMAMVFVNKAVVMQYLHSMSLLTLQQLVTALIIHFGQVLRVSKRKDLSITTAKKLLPVSIFYNANVAFALASLKGVNIPMYIAIKRLTPLAVLVSGFVRGKGKPPTQVSLSVVCTAAGVLVAALGDFSFDLYGYCMALTSVFFQTMYLILVEKSGAEDGLSSVELMFYNSVLSLPFLFFIIIATGEFPHSLSVLSEKTVSLSFSVILVISLVMGIVLNFTMFWCTIVNSALTTTIVGVLKGVGSTTLGFVLLGGVEVHALNVTGLVINTLGGVWYSYVKYTQKKKMPRKIVPDEESHPHK